MRKFAWLATVLLALSFTLSTLFSVPASAIGEVTPTPDPNETEAPAEETTVEVDVEALIDEGFEDIQNGDYRSALGKMDVVIEADDTATTAFLIRGVANSQLGFTEDAVADFSRAIELEPWQQDYYFFRGEAYTADGQHEAALADFAQVIRINPFAGEGFLSRSNAYYELGENLAGDVDDLVARAIGALGQGDSLSALGFLDEAIEAGEGLENIGNAYYLRAIANSGLGDEDATLEDYASALEANPALHIVHLARGIFHREDGDIVAAGTDFAQRMEIHGQETIAESMSIGETIEVEMQYRRVVEVSFEGEAGQVISLSATDSGSTVTDPLIALLDPNGSPIAGDDDFGNGFNSLIEDFELPEDGTYTLMVAHAEGGNEFGFRGVIEVEINEE